MTGSDQAGTALMAAAGVGAEQMEGGAGGADSTALVPTFTAAADGSPVEPPIKSLGYAWEIAVGDVNADGHLDLVSGRDFDGAAVALGRGDGTFQYSADYAGTLESKLTTVFGLALADFDHDGDVDLAVGVSFPNDPDIADRVGLLKNDGSGHFGELKEIPLPKRAMLGFGNMVAADFDADGWMDIVAGSGPALSVLLNDQAGGFAVSEASGLERLVGLAAADIDGNGSVDLAVSGNVPDGGTLKMLINDGHGKFAEGPAYVVGATYSCGIAIADLDRDSFPDVVVTNPKEAGISMLRSRGDGTFEEPRLIPTGSSRGVVLADLNGDSWVDVAVSGATSVGGMVVLANDRHGGFRSDERFSSGSLDRPIAIVSGDFNEDGAADLAASGDLRPLLVWLNQLR